MEDGIPSGLFSKLAAVTQAMGKLPKSGWNAHFKYAFVRSEDVLETVRKELSERNVAFLPMITGHRVETIEKTYNNEKKIQLKTVLDMMFVFADGDSGETFKCPWVAEAIDDQDKGVTKAVTSGVKYFLLKNFLIPTGEDDPDASNGEQHPEAAKAPAKPGKPAKKAEKKEETPHSQAAFVELAKSKGITNVAEIGAKLREAGFEAFDATKWDDMVKALG